MYVRKVDLGWRAKLTNSQRKAFELVEQAVFGMECDGQIRQHVKNHKSVASLVNTSPIADMVQELEEEVEKEVAATKAKQAGPADSSVEEVEPAAAIDVDQFVDSSGEVIVACIQASLAKVAGTDNEERMKIYKDQCMRTVETFVKLEIELPDMDANMDRFKNSSVNQVHHMHIHAHTDT